MIGHCPERAALACIGRGSDAGSCDPALAAHIEDCPVCREFIELHAQNVVESFNPAFPVDRPLGGALPKIEGFTIERELGRGSTGVVYLARRDAPKRQVALKLWPGGRRASDRERRRWLREAEAASSVRHPNIVTLHEACVTDDWFLLVLEYVPGGTLADQLTQPLAPPIAARWVERIARAIHRIHESGLLHLDLKPSNILLDGDADAPLDEMVPKVSDFGIARSQEAAATDTAGPGAGGTPSYMAPEQISKARSELTAAADTHGLGAILYHALTGRPPYQAATVLETIDHVRRLDAVPPRRLNPGIPRDLETICLNCLQKDPGRRYRTAEALAEDVSRWLDGRAISARRVSAAEKSWRWCRRRPVVAALSGTLLLTIVIGFVAVVDQWRKAEANFQASMVLAGDLMDAITINAEQRMTSIDGRIQLLNHLRMQLLALSSSRAGDPLFEQRLAYTEYLLATELRRANKHAEAERVLLKTLDRMGELARRHLLEGGLRHHLCQCLKALGSLRERLDSLETSVAYYRRAIAICEDALESAPRADLFNDCVYLRRELAWLLFSRGKRDEASRLIMANHHTLNNPPAGCEVRQLALWHVLSHIDLLELIHDPALKNPHETGGNTVAKSSALSRLAPLGNDLQTPVEWARLVREGLHDYAAGSPISARMETEAALSLMDLLRGIASKMRGLHDFERARRLADRMLALANDRVSACPRQPAAHLARSFAYGQVYKNAYAAKEDAAIEPNMKSACDAARDALLIDPANEMARRQVDDLQRRLAGLRRRG